MNDEQYKVILQRTINLASRDQVQKKDKEMKKIKKVKKANFIVTIDAIAQRIVDLLSNFLQEDSNNNENRMSQNFLISNRMYNKASLILDESNMQNCQQHKLWLGGLEDAQNKKWLEKEEINSVFTVAIGQPVSYTNNDIRHHEYPIEDKPIFKIQKYFPEILKLMRKELGNANVLVHCACGVSRSPTIVIAYLMKYKEMSFNQAYAYVKARRPVIKPNNGFIQILQQL